MRNHQQRSAILWTLVMGGVAAALLFTGQDLSAQCEMCRTALTQSAEGQRWSRGINSGIMLLLAAPFLIAGCSLLVIYRAPILSLLPKTRAQFAPGSTSRRTAASIQPYSDR